MKMIDVFNLIAEGKIEKGTKLKFFDNYKNTPEYKYEYVNKYKGFINEDYRELYKYFDVNEEFLKFEVELIPPKEKKYLVKLNVSGLRQSCRYVNYYENGVNQWIELKTGAEYVHNQTRFTKSELQSIKAVREFLDDMVGKYELIEVEECD